LWAKSSSSILARENHQSTQSRHVAAQARTLQERRPVELFKLHDNLVLTHMDHLAGTLTRAGVNRITTAKIAPSGLHAGSASVNSLIFASVY
jgi:hypothetical protein